MIPLTDLPWRVGRKLGRTVYAQISDDASDDDMLIGVMDSIELAQEVVRSHNDRLGVTW